MIATKDVSNKRSRHALDSTYLWHCRLSHINKKRMEKLQRDGNLQPTHDESLEKCKSCISEKMARKPFPHQVERAKELLGLIHTDVCGPFRIVSREGASYFITLQMISAIMSFWGYALDSTTRILNMVPTKKVDRMSIPKGKMGYYFYYPLKDKIFVARNAEFFENNLILQEASRSHGLLKASRSDIFKKKTDMDGNVHIFKSRLVAKGYTQTFDVDYGETFSHVANIRAIRVLLAIVPFYDYEIWKMDVKIAFLNGHLSEDVYMVQPEGFVDPKHPNKCAKLQRSIYGLKQASWSWKKRFDEEIKKVSFTQNPDEPCVYLKASGSNVIFLLLYVDDILIMGNNITMLQDVKSWLSIGSIIYAIAVKTILKYLSNTKDMVLVYGGKPEAELKVTFSVNAEAEYIVAAEASMEAIWMRKFINGLGNVMPSNKRPMEMLCDNALAIAIANDPEIMKGASHY
ncbi:retrotransposon protein, putative, ty1-copia subclass [Tanacetum coccineum]